MTLLAIMLFYYSHLGEHASFCALLPGLLIGGTGMALTMTPTTAAAMSSVPVDKAGVGSAVLNSMRQVGGSLGIAVMGAVVASASASSLAAGDDREARLPARLPRRAARSPRCWRWPARSSRRRRSASRRTTTRSRRRRSSRLRERHQAAAVGRRTAAGRCSTRPAACSRSRAIAARRPPRSRGRPGITRADPLPAFRLEARPVSRVPRGGVAQPARVVRAGDRRQTRHVPRGGRRRLHGEAGAASAWSTSGSRR